MPLKLVDYVLINSQVEPYTDSKVHACQTFRTR